MHNFVIKEMHQLQYACVKMEEIDAVSEGISSKFKPILIYHSVRKQGYVYELTAVTPPTLWDEVSALQTKSPTPVIVWL